jgi:ubiquinone/menaquinone biosynthesis C-methylase UbiE
MPQPSTVTEKPDTEKPESWSHERTIDRFDSPQVAGKYPAAYGTSFRDHREKSCLLTALQGITAGSQVLDLPCGAGRLTRLLVEAGMHVTGADSSSHMVEHAQQNWRNLCAKSPSFDRNVKFEVRDVMDTGYEDRQFDAVFCNRLFHHFNDSGTRVAALTELQRITRTAVVVSFFNSFAIDAVRFRLKYWLRGTPPQDRIPIPMNDFAADVNAAGLEIDTTIPVMWGLSPMWYVVARPRTVAKTEDTQVARAA